MNFAQYAVYTLPGLHEAQSILRVFAPTAKISCVTIQIDDSNTLRATYVVQNLTLNKDMAAHALAHRAKEQDGKTTIQIGDINAVDSLIVIQTRDDRWL